MLCQRLISKLIFQGSGLDIVIFLPLYLTHMWKIDHFYITVIFLTFTSISRYYNLKINLKNEITMYQNQHIYLIY